MNNISTTKIEEIKLVSNIAPLEENDFSSVSKVSGI